MCGRVWVGRVNSLFDAVSLCLMIHQCVIPARLAIPRSRMLVFGWMIACGLHSHNFSAIGVLGWSTHRCAVYIEANAFFGPAFFF